MALNYVSSPRIHYIFNNNIDNCTTNNIIGVCLPLTAYRVLDKIEIKMKKYVNCYHF